MKTKTAITSLFCLFLFAATPVWAQVQMNTISAPSAMADPLSGFTINYTMTGSKYGVGAASAQVKFYISASANGSTGVWVLDSRQILLRGSGLGPYYPPLGTQSVYVSRYNMPSNTVALLESIAAGCQPQTWYILGQVDSTAVRSTSSVLGTSKQPDFFFTGGTISPNVIQPGGTTNISFNLYTKCPAYTSSTVGVFLADANLQLLSYIGGISISAGAGTFSLPPTPITFSPYIAPGVYHIVLIADVDGVIAESNENNNAGAFRLDITSALAASDKDVGELERDVGTLDARLPAEVAPAQYDVKFGVSEDFLQGH